MTTNNHSQTPTSEPKPSTSLFGRKPIQILKAFFSCFFDFCGIIGAGKAVNKSAASAASPDSVKFQAMIKSAASAASSKPKSREGSSRGVQDGGSAGGRRPRGTPPELPSLDLGFLEAALAADLLADSLPLSRNALMLGHAPHSPVEPNVTVRQTSLYVQICVGTV